MRKVLAVVVMTALVLAGTAGSANAAKKGVCKNRTNVNLKLCASLNYDSREVWMTGQGTKISNAPYAGHFKVQGSLMRSRCGTTSWQTVARSETVTGHDRLQVITTDIRLQKGYRYRAVISAVDYASDVAAVAGPVLSRC